MNQIIRYLNYHIQGCVYDKPSVLAAYSKDQSILKIKPRIVAVPDTKEDVSFLVRFANELATKGYQLPVSVWGSGLDRTGADLSKGMIISTEKLDHIKEIDDRARLVRAEAGCTLNKLNSVLSVYGLNLPIKANGNETIGGLISSFNTDDYAKKYGGIYYFVERMEVVLSNGEVIQTSPLATYAAKRKTGQTNFEGKIYRETYKLIEKNFDVLDNLKAAPRDLSGYRMITEVKKGGTFDLMPIFLGSQGSLGVITEVILRVESLPRTPKRMLSRFTSIEDVAEYAEKVKTLKPLSVNLIDSRIVRIAATAGKTFDIVSKPVPGSFYVVTTFNDNFIRTGRSLKAATDLAKKAKFTIIEDGKNSRDFDNLNDVFDIYLNDEATRPIVTGATRVPADKFVEFAHRLDEFEEKFGRKMPIFGSLLTELLEVRPSFDLASVLERKQAIMFFKDYANMIDSIGGAMAGGGAEGRTKAAVTNSRISARERDFYSRIKLLFDPNNILAPDIKLGATVQELVRNLRTDEIPGFIV